MKQQSDSFTGYAFEKPHRGRPRKPDAKSHAQRQREFRQRQKFNFLNAVTSNENSKNITLVNFPRSVD